MKGIIVEKFKDQTIPKEYLERVFSLLKVRNVGLATVEKNEGLLRLSMAGEPNVEGMMKVQETWSGGMVFFLGEYPDPLIEGDIQPEVLLTDAKDKPIVVGFLTGSFPNYDKNDSHTVEHHVSLEYLYPKIDALNGLCEDDHDKLGAQLNTNAFKNDITNLIVGEGSIVFLLDTGKVIHFHKNENSKQYDWGRVSDHLNWESVKAEGSVDVPVPAKELTAAEKLKAAMSGSKPITTNDPKIDDTPIAPPKAEATNVQPTGKDVKFSNLFGSKAIPASIASQFELHTPPSTITNFRDLRKWYKNKGGYHATDEEVMGRISIFSKKDLDKIRLMVAATEAKDAGSLKVIVPPKDNPADALAAAARATQDRKNTENKHLPTKATETVREAVPYLSDEAMTTLQPHLKKLRGDDGKSLPDDPKNYHVLEAKIPTFTEKAGLQGISQTFKFDFTDLKGLAKQLPEAAALLIMEMRQELIKSWQRQAATAPSSNDLSPADKLKQAMKMKVM